MAEEVPPPVQPAKPNTPKPKTKLELKIEEREAREREEAERKKEILAAAEAKEKAARSAAGADLSPELADKIRRQALEEASDFDAARDAFGEGQTPKARPAPAAAPGDTIEAADPKTDKDFERLASKINEKLAKYEGKKGHMVCLKALIRSCTANMSSDDCKDLSSTLAVISNDKLKADRDKDKSKVKKNKARAARERPPRRRARAHANASSTRTRLSRAPLRATLPLSRQRPNSTSRRTECAPTTTQ